MKQKRRIAKVLYDIAKPFTQHKPKKAFGHFMLSKQMKQYHSGDILGKR
jgi:hypothetical protein